MHDDMKAIVCELLKFIFFGCYIALAILFVILITSMDIQALGHIPESSWTERTQEALLGISMLLFLYRIKQEQTSALYLVVGLLACMLIREWDVLFDNIFHGAWKFIAIPAAILFIHLALKDDVNAACQHLKSFFNTPAYHLLFAGLIIVLVVSRIIGMRFMVQIISGPHFQQSIKSFLEEGTELLGYIIIFTSSFLVMRDWTRTRLYDKRWPIIVGGPISTVKGADGRRDEIGGDRSLKQNPIKREAIEHLYAYSAIKGALISDEDEAAEREEIESAAFGQARDGPPTRTGANSDVTLRTVMVRIVGKARKIAVDTKARLWIDAIESAWAELLTYEPEIAELMEMTFHLRSGEGKRSGRMYVQARVCDKLHISDRTYYAWRNLAVNTVIYHYTTAQRKIIDTYLQQIF